MPLPGALYTQKPIDPKTELFARAWLLYFNSLATGTGVAAAPADAQYLVAATNGILTAERVATDTNTVAWDFTTPAQAKANVPDDSITYAKMQDGSQTSMLLGVGTVLGTGELREITLGSGLSMSADVLNTTTVLSSVAIALTDAQIKALPTTPITVVAAPAAGSFVKVIAASLTVDSTAGAYTNINATFCAAFGLAYGPIATSQQAAVAPLLNDSSMTTALTGVTTALNTSLGKRHVDYVVPNSFAYDAGAVSGVANWVYNPNDGATTLYDGIALSVSTDNNGSGNFTGGNAANSAKITVLYRLEVL